MLVSSVFGLAQEQELNNKSSPRIVYDARVGVEVELEGLPGRIEGVQRDSRIDRVRWNVIEDGSLRGRNSGEFVFNQPMFGEDVVIALENLQNFFDKEVKRPPVLSERTSVHVHLDVRDMSDVQLVNMMILYLLTEPAFFTQAGEDRFNNYYCVPLGRSSAYIKSIARSLVDLSPHSFRTFISPDHKYSAVNFNPLSTQGSIEFRHHRGEYKSEPLISWINMIVSLKKFVKESKHFSSNIMDTNTIEELSMNLPILCQDMFGDIDIDIDVSSCVDYSTTLAKYIVQEYMSGKTKQPDIPLIELDKEGSSRFLNVLGIGKLDKDTLNYVNTVLTTDKRYKDKKKVEPPRLRQTRPRRSGARSEIFGASEIDLTTNW